MTDLADALAFLLALAACSAVLVLPFVPALREWRSPTDNGALAVPAKYRVNARYFARKVRAAATAQDPGAAVQGDFHGAEGDSHDQLVATGRMHLGPRSRIAGWAHADGALHLGSDSVALRRLTSDTSVELAPGCCFERVHAPVVRFAPDSAAAAPAAPPPARELQHWAQLPGARQATASLCRFSGDCELPAGGLYVGNVVVAGTLRLGAGTVVCGNVKAGRGIVLGPGALVRGAVVCRGSIRFMPQAGADGPVVSEDCVVLQAHAQVGRSGAPTTVNAKTVLAEPGATAHGTVWAHQAGVVWQPA